MKFNLFVTIMFEIDESDNTRNYGNLRKKYLNDKLESYIDD